MANKSPNTKSLINHAKQKKYVAFKKVETAIKKMIKNQVVINFNSVAKEAGVSKSFLYKNAELKERIEKLRQQQEGLSSSKQVKRNMTDTTKDVLIEALRKKITALGEENKDLKQKMNDMYAKMYKEL